MKKLLSTITAATLMTSALAVEISGEYSVVANIINRGASVNGEKLGGAASIAFDSNGFTLEFDTFSVDGETEIDTALSYTTEIYTGVEAYIAVLDIRNSSTYNTQADLEYSAGITTTIVDLGVGFDYMKDKASTWNIKQLVVGKSFGDLGIEALIGKQTFDIDADTHTYKQVSVSYPSGKGDWAFVAADSDANGSDATYSVAHTFSF